MADVMKIETLKNKTRESNQRIFHKYIKQRHRPCKLSHYISERLEDEVLKEVLYDVVP